ncbi:MAG TPA: hypothetical protein VGP08_16820 [Pyrinomonadaceae bacterium]|jgi:hypothetical protein|nr:hypothetical protein [Pyrinomonadaceae bacterium]
MNRDLTQTLLATLLVASTAFAARAQSTRQKSDPPPRPVATIEEPKVEQPFDLGKLEGGAYSNDFFGFSMTLPKGWVVLGPEENKKILDTGKDLVEKGTTEKKKQGLEDSVARTHFLVTASKYPTGMAGANFNALLICIAERVPTAIIKTGTDYVSVMQRSFEGTAAKLELTAPLRTQKLGGADFTVADVKMTAGPVVTAQRYYVRISKGHALTLAYTYYDEADLKTFDELLGTVKFK